MKDNRTDDISTSGKSSPKIVLNCMETYLSSFTLSNSTRKKLKPTGAYHFLLILLAIVDCNVCIGRAVKSIAEISLIEFSHWSSFLLNLLQLSKVVTSNIYPHTCCHILLEIPRDNPI